MSVQVAIEIADGAAVRHLSIHNLTPGLPAERDLDAEHEYEVFVCNNRDLLNPRRATFTHRYGDDVTVLIAKAGQAIRDQHGRL